MNKQTKIAVFFGGKISQHLVLVKRAAKKLGVDLTLVSYNRVCFDSKKQKVLIRPNLADESKIQKIKKYKKADDYDVLFFRTTGKHWEEVDLINDSIKRNDVVVVDPLVRTGKPSMACKAWQMLILEKAGIEVPMTTYGSLWYLYETMVNKDLFNFPVIIKGSGGDRGTRVYKADNLEQLEKLVRDLRKSAGSNEKKFYKAG